MWQSRDGTTGRPSYHPVPSEYELKEPSLLPPQASNAWFKLYRYCSWVLLCVCLLQGFAISILLQYSRKQDHGQAWVNTPVPPASWVLRPFNRDPSMANLQDSRDVEEAWRGYETTAFVHVPNPQAYSLPPNKNVVVGIENVYMLSAYHQLHCLKKLQLAFVSMMRNETAQEDIRANHAEHCFEYLRHGIICAGDATLEGPDEEDRGQLTGYGTVHRCRAWDEPGGLDLWRKMNAPAVKSTAVDIG